MSPSDVLPILESRVLDTVRADAVAVDREGRFPHAAMEALARAGFLGLATPTAHGGHGLGLDAAARVVERLARECGSTAMVTCMHYCGAAVLAAHGSEAVNREVAAGRHLSTLAFSEAGSRSHFWAPVSTAREEGDTVVLDARKSWVTSAGRATAYVWSSRPAAAEGASTLWLVPRDAPGLTAPAPFDGIGLRGNDSTPLHADGVRIPAANRLGADGQGFALMMGIVLPWFSILNAACALGLAEAATARAAAHVAGTAFAYSGASLRELPTIRAYLARMRVRTDLGRALWEDSLAALGSGRADAQLRVLEVKAALGETAQEVTTLAMRVCGGAAFRKEVGVDRYFRDAQAMGVMAPTTDVLYDFIGKAVTGMELFG